MWLLPHQIPKQQQIAVNINNHSNKQQQHYINNSPIYLYYNRDIYTNAL